MKKQFFWWITLVLPFASAAQGIQFKQDLSWQQVKQQAKLENKYIFIDCSASWCMPCKKMESEVFTLKNVGDFMNANFISVHVQMDTSETDNLFVKSWYGDANDLRKSFRIKTFPSYLFFSPDGTIVHRYLYALSDSNFLKIAKAAIDSNKQYYSLLTRYQSGKPDSSRLGYLATITKQIGEEALAYKMAKDYLKYLNTRPDKELMLKKYFDFSNTFPGQITSKDKLFNLIYNKGNKVDELMDQKGFSRSYVQAVIGREELSKKLWANNKTISFKPDWKQLTAAIQRKYSKFYSELVVTDAQVKWYSQKKDTSNIIKYRIKYLDTYGLDTTGIGWVYINNFAWNYVFAYCTNRDTLNKVAAWMRGIIENHPGDYVSFDTYANLLYKAGRKAEAIEWEMKAVELEAEDAKRNKKQPDAYYKQAVNKMKSNLPTW